MICEAQRNFVAWAAYKDLIFRSNLLPQFVIKVIDSRGLTQQNTSDGLSINVGTRYRKMIKLMDGPVGMA